MQVKYYSEWFVLVGILSSSAVALPVLHREISWKKTNSLVQMTYYWWKKDYIYVALDLRMKVIYVTWCWVLLMCVYIYIVCVYSMEPVLFFFSFSFFYYIYRFTLSYIEIDNSNTVGSVLYIYIGNSNPWW